MLFFVTPKFCVCIVFSFSWGHFNSQEKLTTMLMHNFGMSNKEHYGMLWYFLGWSIVKLCWTRPGVAHFCVHEINYSRWRRKCRCTTKWVPQKVIFVGYRNDRFFPIQILVFWMLRNNADPRRCSYFELVSLGYLWLSYLASTCLQSLCLFR